MRPINQLPPLPPQVEAKFLKIEHNPITDTEKHTIAYLDWEYRGTKDNIETLFCVHGLTRNAHDFDIIASYLSSFYRVIALDMPGRGNSNWLEDKKSYNYFTYAYDCLHLLEHENLEQVHWLGTSMGGIIAMVISTMKPEIFKSLILNDIGKTIPKQAMQRIADYAAREHIFNSFSEAEDFLKLITEPFGIKNPIHWKRFSEFSIWEIDKGVFTFSCDPGVLDAVESASLEEDIDLEPFWEHVTCPTLLLRGENSDILTKDIADEMARSEHVDLIEIKGTGHAPSLTEDGQISIIKNWLEEIK